MTESLCINYPTEQKVVSQTAFKKKTISKLIPLEMKLFFLRVLFIFFSVIVNWFICLLDCPWFWLPIATPFRFSWFTEGQACVAKVVSLMYFCTVFLSIKYASCNIPSMENVADDVLLLQKEHKHAFQFRLKICIYYRYPDETSVMISEN